MGLRTLLPLIVALAGKDWRLFWADRRAAALCFAVPIILASAFGLVFDRPDSAAGVRLPLLVVAEADGPLTRQLVADLLANPRTDARVVSAAEADRLVA